MPRQGFEPLTAYEHMVIWLGMSKPILSHRAIELLAARFRILGDPTRLALLQHLQHDELSVSELTQLSGTSQPNVSKHLKHMLQAGIVGRRQDGSTAFYRVVDPTVFELCNLVCESMLDHLESEAEALKT